MKFRISATTKDGDTYEEVIEAADRFAVYRDIRERGDRVVELKEEKFRHTFSFSFLTDIFNNISSDDKVILTRNLAAMLEAGLTTSRALGVMERQTKNPHLRSILSAIIADVKRGSAFSASLAKFPQTFPPLMVSMSKAGEESGKLSESLRVIGVQMEHASNLTKKIRGALIYPAIVLIVMVGIAILMLMFVVPTLAKTFKELGTELPLTTQIIINTSSFLTDHTVLALGAMFAFVLLFVMFGRSDMGKRTGDWVFLRIPIIKGLVMETNAARTTRTLASLLASGVDVVYSITITREVVENHYYRDVLSEAEVAVTKGAQLSEAFSKHPELYPPLVAEMIAVGEETGRLSALLKETAEFYEESVERQTKDLSTVIEPFLMITIGAFVGFFALSMIAPIYSLSSSIK